MKWFSLLLSKWNSSWYYCCLRLATAASVLSGPGLCSREPQWLQGAAVFTFEYDKKNDITSPKVNTTDSWRTILNLVIYQTVVSLYISIVQTATMNINYKVLEITVLRRWKKQAIYFWTLQIAIHRASTVHYVCEFEHLAIWTMRYIMTQFHHCTCCLSLWSHCAY